MKTIQCYSLHNWIFRGRCWKYALRSNNQKATACTHVRGSTPDSLAYSRLFSLNRKLLTVFPSICRILRLPEKPQLLFQSVMFFPTVPIVANYECCKQHRNRIPNYSRLIQNRVASVQKSKVSNILQDYAGVFKPKTIQKGGFLEFNGEYLAQAAKSYL